MSSSLAELFSDYKIVYNYIPLHDKKPTDTLKGTVYGVDVDDYEHATIKADFSYNGTHWNLYENRLGSIDRRVRLNPPLLGVAELSAFSKFRNDRAEIYVGDKPRKPGIDSPAFYLRCIGLGLVAVSSHIASTTGRQEAGGTLEVTKDELMKYHQSTVFKRLLY